MDTHLETIDSYSSRKKQLIDTHVAIQVLGVFDLHGHSSKQNIFIYGYSS